jgi:hypothetical protein
MFRASGFRAPGAETTLGIEIIGAYSPRAKGRVQRKHGVYRDRFVKELRLRGATKIAEANMILWTSSTDMWRWVGARTFLTSPGIEETRCVSHDWVVRNDHRFCQLSRGKEGMPRAGSKVTVRMWLDGSVHLLHEGRRLPFKEFDHHVQARRNVG